ncbi:hypothetical protein RI367_004950 [Sorochytrium milnesiophthora]
MSAPLAQTSFDPTRPLSDQERLCVAIALVVMAAGAFSNMALVSVTLKRRKKLLGDISSMLVLHLNVVDMIYCTPLVLLQVLKLATNDRSVLGQLGCNMEGFILCTGSLASAAGLLCIGVERYHAIVKERPRDGLFWAIALACGWLHGLVLALLPVVIPNYGYTLQPCGAYCLHDWRSREPLHAFVVIFAIVDLLLISALIAYVYLKIYDKVRAVQQEVAAASKKHIDISSSVFKMSSIPSAGTSANAKLAQGTAQRQTLQQLVFVKCATLTASFFVAWIGYTWVMILSFSGVPIPAWADGLAAVFGMLCSTFNCVCVAALDVRVRAMLADDMQRIRSYFCRSSSVISSNNK